MDGLEIELNLLKNQPIAPSQNFNNWDLAFLTDYIVNTHHKYVLKTLPELVFYTQKIVGNQSLIDIEKRKRWLLFPYLKKKVHIISYSPKGI